MRWHAWVVQLGVGATLFHTLTVAVTHRSMNICISFRWGMQRGRRGKEATENETRERRTRGVAMQLGQCLGCWDVVGSRLTEPLPIRHRHVLILASSATVARNITPWPQAQPVQNLAPVGVFGVSGVLCCILPAEIYVTTRSCTVATSYML